MTSEPLIAFLRLSTLLTFPEISSMRSASVAANAWHSEPDGFLVNKRIRLKVVLRLQQLPNDVSPSLRNRRSSKEYLRSSFDLHPIWAVFTSNTPKDDCSRAEG